MLLRTAGIEPGMRVLDLGAGPGHVTFQAAEMVGPTGSVVGVDRDERMVDVGRKRAREANLDNVAFAVGDARTWRDEQPFDALVTRLLLFHLPDADDVLRHHRDALRPGGLALAIDFDVGALRTEPPVEIVARSKTWIEAAFRSAGASPAIGTRLGVMLDEAGFADVSSLGLQVYLEPRDAAGPKLLSGVVRSLAPQILAEGIASEEELGLDDLEQRASEEIRDANAVLLLPTVVGAWGRRPS